VSQASFGGSYRAIDQAREPTALLTYLDEMSELAPVRAAKDAATAALELCPGEHVLEIGCGTGVDLPALADAVGSGGRVTGVDPSRGALLHAAERVRDRPWVELLEAGLEGLAVEGPPVDACRIDRTVQHLVDPEAALRHLHGLMRTGGRLSILELQAALVGPPVDHPSHARVVDAGARRFWSPQERGAWIAPMLPLLLAKARFGSIDLRLHDVVSGDPEVADVVLRLRDNLAEAVAGGDLTAAEVGAWWHQLRRAMDEGRIEAHLSFATVVAIA
jgi:ubiquinone/menaquinone biosynthesis C-methylase UbiE